MNTTHDTTTTAPALTAMQQAERLSHQLVDLTPGEVLHMITSAGLAAVKRAVDLHGQLTLPLEFNITPPGKLPVHLPAGMVTKLDAMGACIGLKNGAASYITEVLSDGIKPGGEIPGVMLSLWEVSAPGIIEELYRIHRGEG